MIEVVLPPMISGTRCSRPVAKMPTGGAGRTHPSVFGPLPAPASRSAVSSSPVEQERRYRSVSLEGALSFSATSSPARSTCAIVAEARSNPSAPLSPIARWNKPFESGEAMSARTSMEPADWPKMVTLPGSPPNCAILSWTHWSAAIWSRIP